MYLGMDGTGIPMRASELQGRKGKQTDGSAKTREVKLCTVVTAESVDDKGMRCVMKARLAIRQPLKERPPPTGAVQLLLLFNAS